MAGNSDAILGFRPHTGWAAVVVVSPGEDAPTVLERQRISYEPAAGRFLYHQAAEASPQEAERLVATGRAQAQEAAAGALKVLLAELDSRSVRVTAAAIPVGNTRLPTNLADILSAHSRIHAAEGVFYRETVADACAALGLTVHRPPERDLAGMAAARMGVDSNQVTLRIRELGRALGPPWSEDQKLATMAAWTCVGARPMTAGPPSKRKPRRILRVL